jgi:hypothetical protein
LSYVLNMEISIINTCCIHVYIVHMATHIMYVYLKLVVSILRKRFRGYFRLFLIMSYLCGTCKFRGYFILLLERHRMEI